MEERKMNEIKRYETYQNNDEIDLYDLVEILVKNKMTIIVTTILVTLISLGAALAVRKDTKLKFAQDINIVKTKDFFIKKAEINPEPVRLTELLENSMIQKKYFENSELENFYKKSLGTKVDTYSARKDFLGKIVKIEEVTKEDLSKKTIIKNMAIVIELPKEQENLKEYLANRYIELYENEVQIELKKSLDEKYSQVKTEKEKYETELKVL
ncbi:MAG: Wzz/FepE/Etk N-terminal domain-containing protein, partial [Fusobacteriaceae bacterium]